VLNREQILNAQDRPQVCVSVDVWGGDVLLTALSVKDRAEVLGDWSKLGAIQKEGGDAVAALLRTKLKLIALSITDEKGVCLFTVEDIDALARKSEAAIGKIADEAVLLNRFFVSDTEDAAKN
jgi:hypothetical protein